MTIRCMYNLDPGTLAVEAGHGDLLHGFESFLGKPGSGHPALPLFTVSIAIGHPASPPCAAETLYSGPLPDEGDCLFARADDVYFMVFPGQASMEINTVTGCGTIIVSKSHLWRAAGSMVSVAIEFASDYGNRPLVHSAGLALPEGRGMMLVTAPSGTGKTTAALALARHGFSLAADDVVALRRDGARIMAKGLPRAINIHRRTAEMLPGIPVEDSWDARGEQSLPFHRLTGIVPLEERELAVSRLVLLGRGPSTMVRSLSATEMLAALVADNVRGSLVGLTPLQSRRFAMLGDLVRTVPACHVTLVEGLAGIETAVRILASQSFGQGPDERR